MKRHEVLLKPVLTEKATGLAKDGVYSFEVDRMATKFQIKSSIENLYPVKVDRVTVMIRKGKEKKVGKRLVPKKLSDYKIAYVKVKSGKIDLFPQT